MNLPVAEVFESIQGEGQFSGTPMTFIRLAGCTVGKPYVEKSKCENLTHGLAPYQEECTTWAGEKFPCDTNYRMASRPSLADLVKMPEVTHARRICLTGGEPLMHDVSELLDVLNSHGKKTHIETSGTILIERHRASFHWLTVSPKYGCLPKMLETADEIKVLVGTGFDEAAFVQKFRGYMHKVWLSPINGEFSLDMTNARRCIELVQKYKELRLNTQLHKIFGVR